MLNSVSNRAAFVMRKISIDGSEHDLHMKKGDGHQFAIKNVLPEDFVEMCRSQDLRAVFASIQKMLEHTAEESSTI
jgi:hypothetical protein